MPSTPESAADVFPRSTSAAQRVSLTTKCMWMCASIRVLRLPAERDLADFELFAPGVDLVGAHVAAETHAIGELRQGPPNGETAAYRYLSISVFLEPTVYYAAITRRHRKITKGCIGTHRHSVTEGLSFSRMVVASSWGLRMQPISNRTRGGACHYSVDQACANGSGLARRPAAGRPTSAVGTGPFGVSSRFPSIAWFPWACWSSRLT